MYDSECLKASEAVIDEQLSFIKACYPHLKQITKVDNNVCMESDYIDGIDARAMYAGKTVTIQCKIRKPGHPDLLVPAIKLSGQAAMEGDIGFMYRGKKYLFRPKADITCIRVGGTDYCVTAEELKAVEASYPCDIQRAISGIKTKLVYADDGHTFPSGEYYVFIKPANMAKIKFSYFMGSFSNFPTAVIEQCLPQT